MNGSAGSGMAGHVDVAGYLGRLDLGELTQHRPRVEALEVLHRAHAERVPCECLEVRLDRPTTVDPAESARRVAGGGGYCFHLNGGRSRCCSAPWVTR
ncbi:arylamine N-acetyltransferase [Microbispora corallina]|uniref:arylamine N-acetyltransferase n=1 Tax=Microbispora corallina TaxID=83302 RepID=UPI001EF1D805|nr:arylamine N-acetyltransferase [Microbispora corallina]